MARPSGRPIREEVIEAACTMVQRVGVHALSYGALATEVGISSPSIHHHFRTKDDLVAEVAHRYRRSFNDLVDNLSGVSVRARLTGYATLFDNTSSKELMCFCGSVASEWVAVGARAQGEVAGFFADQVEWVTSQLNLGVESGEFVVVAAPVVVAQTFVSALEGAMLLDRAGDVTGVPASVGVVLVDALLISH